MLKTKSDASREGVETSARRRRRESFSTTVPAEDEEDERKWFLSVGVDAKAAIARVMESRLRAARVEEERLRELARDASEATKKTEGEAERKRREIEAVGAGEGRSEPTSPTIGGGEDDGAQIVAPVLQPWDVMVTVARAREEDAKSAANRADLVCKKLAHTVSLWEMKSAKRAHSDVQKHLKKIMSKKGRRLADAARTKEAATTAKEDFERELAELHVREDKRLAADVLMAEASANMHAARTSLQNARDRKRGILSTFRQAVRTSVESSIDLMEFRQTEFALRATNVTKTMFSAYDEMTLRLERALMNAIDQGGRSSPRKPVDHERVLDIEATAALTARDRAEASLNDATSQCMAEMRALEVSTRTLLDDVDAEIKAGIEEYYAAAEHERKCYVEAQRATIACKESRAACDVYEEAAGATEQMSIDADRWAASLDREIDALQEDLRGFETRHLEAAANEKAALSRVENAEADAIAASNAPVSAITGRVNSITSVFDGITNFSTKVRVKATRQDSDTIVSLRQLSIQAGLESPRISDSMALLASSIPDANTTVESIMERAQELQNSQDVQHLTRTVSRNALAYKPMHDR